MGEAARSPTEIISLPQGGGAMHGIGETFSPDAQKGTGNFSLALTVPPGRNGFQPQLDLVYSTGNGNGRFGLGWALPTQGITRKTSRGVPTYHDADDTFIRSGVDDLVPVGTVAGAPAFRPRTEGSFARILHFRDPTNGDDYWEVTGIDGVVSRHGTRRPANAPPGWRDPAVVANPDDPSQIFAWQITERRDLLGNVVAYRYELDEGADDNHRWCVPVLRSIEYADYTAADGTTRFLAAVVFEDETRDDAFSSYSAGFEVRSTRRCRAITTMVNAPQPQRVRRYELDYEADPHNGMSMLRAFTMIGYDDAGTPHTDMPPTTFTYGRFEPETRRFQPVRGREPPGVALSHPDYELVDLTGDGLPDVLELNGVARYWRNLGDGAFDLPRSLGRVPAGLALAARGVQLLDADGDGRTDLLVTAPTGAGYFPLRFGPQWGHLHPYGRAPSFSFEDDRVRLVDLTGDGVTDVLHTGPRPECFFGSPAAGWTGPQPVRSGVGAEPPPLDTDDARVRWADMTGDGLTDVVVVNRGSVRYWPNLGHGRFGAKVEMQSSHRLPYGYVPERLLLADVDGDGLADLVHVEEGRVTVWFNRSGDAWSAPITVPGVPEQGWDVRITDLLGTGTGGVLWSRDAPATGRPAMYFLGLTTGVKPRLLIEVDNGLGALTRISYESSTAFAVADGGHADTRWRTPLPFPVPVVATVESIAPG